MATGGPPITGEIGDMRSLQTKFMFDLLKYVYEKYEIAGVFREIQTYQNVLELRLALEEKGRKGKSRKKTKAQHDKPFCEHLGQAIIALSHLHRRNFKVRFHSVFGLVLLNIDQFKLFLLNQVREIFNKEDDSYAKFNEFLIVCGFLVEVNVYLAFRGVRGSSFTVWAFYDHLYDIVMKTNFERHGSWAGLKRAARPWWQYYKRAVGSGVKIHKPENVYYNVYYNPTAYPLERYPIIVHKFYVDSGDSLDVKDDPLKARPDDRCKIACGSRGCYYFCIQRPKLEDFMQTTKSKKPEKSAQKITKCAQAARECSNASAQETPAQPGASAAEPEHIFFVHVPGLIDYGTVYDLPDGFISRSEIKRRSEQQ